jgi:hypothetical protein
MLNQDYIDGILRQREQPSNQAIANVMRLAATEFSAAAHGLSAIIGEWQSRDESGDSERHNAVSKHYPFQRSFDEEVAEIAKWAETLSNESIKIETLGSGESITLTSEQANYLLDCLNAADDERQYLQRSGSAPVNSDGLDDFEHVVDLHGSIFDQVLRAKGGEQLVREYES